MMKRIKKDDKLICLKTIYDISGNIIFKEGYKYQISYIDNEQIKIEVVFKDIKGGYDLDFIYKNFK